LKKIIFLEIGNPKFKIQNLKPAIAGFVKLKNLKNNFWDSKNKNL